MIVPGQMYLTVDTYGWNHGSFCTNVTVSHIHSVNIPFLPKSYEEENVLIKDNFLSGANALIKEGKICFPIRKALAGMYLMPHEEESQYWWCYVPSEGSFWLFHYLELKIFD